MPMFDTLALKTVLLNNDMPEPQAMAIVEALADADTGQIATKAEMERLRGDMGTEIAGLRGDMGTEIAGLRGNINMLRWMGGVILALLLTLLWKVFMPASTALSAGGG